MAKKMSKARKALFTPYPWCDEDQQNSLHRQLEDKTTFDKLIKLYSTGLVILPFTGNKEKDGNLIIEHYLKNHNPDQERQRLERRAKCHEARSRHFDAFHRTFGVSVSKYWSNPLFGFDSLKFDEDIVKSGDNESVVQAIERQWGPFAVQMIREFLGMTDTPSTVTTTETADE